MVDVRLEIWNETDDVWAMLDLYEDENISYNARFNDVKDFATVGNFSRDFRIPASDTNISFFGDLFNVNLSGWFDFRRKATARLWVDTILICEGHIQIKKCLRANGSFTEFEIVLYAEMPNLSKAIGDKKFTDITDLSTLNTALEYVSLEDSVDLTLESGNVIYALIEKGQHFDETGAVGTRPIYNESNPLYIGDFTPCVNALWLWQKIFSDAGFYYLGAALDTELEKYWIPWLVDKSVKSTETPQGQLFRVGIDSDLNAQTVPLIMAAQLDEQWDNGANVAAGIFTAPYTGNYTFRAWVHFRREEVSGQSAQFHLRLCKNGNALGDTIAEALSQGLIGDNTQIHQIFLQTELLLVAGDTMQMVLSGDTGYNWDIISSGTYDPNVGTGWELMSCSDPLQDATVDMVLNAPDMKQVDFIRSIIQMHNLVLVPDQTAPNKLTVEFMTDYLGSGDDLDWTGKLDVSKDVQIYPTTELQSRSLEWTYTDDADFLNTLYKEQGKRTYGRQIFEDTGNDFAQGEGKVQISFAPTPCNAIPGTNVVIPKFVNQQGEFINPKPRILYYAGTALGVKVYDFDAVDTADTEVILLSHYQVVDAEIDTNDLNFGMEVPQYSTVGQPYPTLYNRYWRNYIREIYGGLGADDLFDAPFMMEAYFDLKTKDIYFTKFSDKIWIVDSWWRVLEIVDHVIGNDMTTKVKLMKILDVQVECAWTPDSSGAGGLIVFLSSDGVTTGDGTETCCELYGYVWNSTNSKCYTINGSGAPNVPQMPDFPGAGFNGQGSMQLPIASVTSTYTVSPFDYTILVDTTGGAITINLPLASEKYGRTLIIKKTDAAANNVTIDGSGSETIDGATTKVLTARYETYQIQSDGVGWHTIAYKA